MDCFNFAILGLEIYCNGYLEISSPVWKLYTTDYSFMAWWRTRFKVMETARFFSPLFSFYFADKALAVSHWFTSFLSFGHYQTSFIAPQNTIILSGNKLLIRLTYSTKKIIIFSISVWYTLTFDDSTFSYTYSSLHIIEKCMKVMFQWRTMTILKQWNGLKLISLKSFYWSLIL